MPKAARPLGKVILLCLSLLAGLALAEMALRIADSLHTHEFMVWRPGLVMRGNAVGWDLPGVGSGNQSTVNSEGFLGPERPRGAAYEIMAMGGSTTECYFLGAEKAWPCLAQQLLGQVTGERVWIGNAGKSGLTTRDHVIQAERLLPQFPSVDAVLLLVGANDLLLRLERDQSYNPDYLQGDGDMARRMSRAFDRYPDEFRSFPNNLKIFQLIQDLRLYVWLARHHARLRLHPYARYRQMRARARLLDELPDLHGGLAEYRRNLLRIIGHIRAAGMRPIFMTQPVMWRQGLTASDEALLWLGYRGGRGGPEYYSAAALKKGMDMYNQCLLDVCRSEGVECIDLAGRLPRSSGVFYDDCHFTEAGSAMVARLVADYLARHPPLGSDGPGLSASRAQQRPEAP